MGLDPGFARTGYAILTWTKAEGYRWDEGGCIKTKMSTTKKELKRLKLRMTDEDFIRYRTIAVALINLLSEAYLIDTIGIEAFSSNTFQTGGRRQNSGAQKTLAVFGICVGLAVGLTRANVNVSVAGDQQRFLLGKRSGDKETIQMAFSRRYPQLWSEIAKMPKYAREHVVDAAIHAMIAHSRLKG